MKRKKSEELYRQAARIMPGGVNSPVRAFKAVGGTPVFIERGSGCHLFDVDGNDYIDFVGSWGPLILGHSNPAILEAIRDSASRGTTFGAPTEVEIRLAEKIQEAFPSMEMLRLVNSGTEADMSVLRVARGFTEKRQIIKFEGCYHGHHDSLLSAAGSGVATFDLPDSAGVPEDYTRHTISVAFNDIRAVEQLPEGILSDTAAVILEPVAANMGLVPPQAGFLEQLREFTRRRNILLIFDEVITGFRVSFGGAQERFHIEPDLTVLGKIVGGGMPLAAYGGRREIMQKIAPLGPVYQAGTLSGNPVAASAGLAALRILQQENPYESIEAKAEAMLDPVASYIREQSLPVSISRLGSMFTFFFSPGVPRNFGEAKKSDTSAYAKFFWNLLDNGVYIAPSQFETNFVGTAHGQQDLDRARDRFLQALRDLY